MHVYTFSTYKKIFMLREKKLEKGAVKNREPIEIIPG